MFIRLTGFMVFLVGIVLTVGCTGSSILHPQGGMASVGVAYPVEEIEGLGEKAPPQSRKAAVFAASYEEVYRAVVVSASQTQINIERENKSKGLVLGSRVVEALPPVPTCPGSQRVNGISQPRKYFYAIVIKEKGVRSTEVLASVKVQGACWTGHCFEYIDMEACSQYARLHWANLVENPEKELTQLMTFIRNNLHAAGVL